MNTVKKMCGCLLILGIGVLIPASFSYAVEQDSVGGIEFSPRTVPTLPMDPEAPGRDGQPDPDKAGTNGPLSIDYVSDFDFGINEKPTTAATYELAYGQAWHNQGTVTEIPTFIQMTDSRDGDKGWVLKVRQNGAFTHLETNREKLAYKKQLAGTEIRFSNVWVQNINSRQIQQENDFFINSSGVQQVALQTVAGESYGTMQMVFGTSAAGTIRSSVQLYIPMQMHSVYTGKYQTTLTWSLEDVPGDT